MQKSNFDFIELAKIGLNLKKDLAPSPPLPDFIKILSLSKKFSLIIFIFIPT